MKQYTLAVANGDAMLVTIVTDLLKQGWEPLGGPVFVSTPSPLGQRADYLLQAMTRIEPPKGGVN